MKTVTQTGSVFLCLVSTILTPPTMALGQGEEALDRMTSEELERKIYVDHGIRTHGYDSIHDLDYRRFLLDFLLQAERLGLSTEDSRRFIPFDFHVGVEGRRPAGQIVIHDHPEPHRLFVGYKSAVEAVSEIIDRFPLEGTPEADDMAIEYQAIRNAILDRSEYLERWGISVRACPLVAGNCQIDGLGSISRLDEGRLRLLLQGLVNVAFELNEEEDSSEVKKSS